MEEWLRFGILILVWAIEGGVYTWRFCYIWGCHTSSGTPKVVFSGYSKYFDHNKHQPPKKRFFADFFDRCHTCCCNIRFDFLKNQNNNLMEVKK